MVYYSSYIKSILTTGFVAFFCEFILSAFSKNNSAEKAAKFITNLCIFTVIVSPIFSLLQAPVIGNYSFDDDYSMEITEENFIGLFKEELEKRMATEIFQNTCIQTEKLTLKVSCNKNEIKINGITAIVKNETEIEAVYKYISEIISDNKTEITVKTNDKT